MLIDTHCHIHFPDYQDTSVSELLDRARQAGVEKMVLIGTDTVTNQQVAQLSELHQELYYTIGLHPHDAQNEEPIRLADVKKLTTNYPKLVGIGEIGLDYYRNLSPKDTQIAVFRQMLELASQLQLPVVIHDRDAHEDTYQNLKWAVDQWGIRGIIHCFSGDLEFAKKMVDLGFYLSFAGQITFKNAENLRQVAQQIPLKHLLVETDSPYLTPAPHRGKRNEPANVRYTAQKIAEIKKTTLEEVAVQTTQNAMAVFQLDRYS